MQVQSDHIRRRERAWRQGGVEQLVDVLTTRGADFTGASGSGRVATMTRVRGPAGERARSGKSKSARQVPVSGWVVC